MRISIFGLGYVGCVTAVCFAKLGHDVIGFDINQNKIKAIKEAKAPIKEEGLDALLREVVQDKKLIATTDALFAVKNSDISFICVRTSQKEEGILDISEIENVCNNILKVLDMKKGKRHIIAIRSTIPPGTIDKLEALFKKKNFVKGKDFVFASNPEFLREGTAVRDFFEPPYIVVGCDDKECLELFGSFYKEIKAPLYKVSTKTAEAIKFINNSWHALEISFTNEVSGICKKLGVNEKELWQLFCSDTKLNLSPYYFKPNMGYGGSCLPKDLGALQKIGEIAGANCILLNSVSASNILQIKRAYSIIKNEAERINGKEIGIFGVAFKPGTDDLRGSPIIYVIEKLKTDGFKVKIYDPLIKKEQIESIRNSYRDTIYDPLLNELMEVKNFRDLLNDMEKMLCSLEEVLECKIIVMNAQMQPENLQNLKDEQIIVNTRAIIPIENKEKIKAEYIEAW